MTSTPTTTPLAPGEDCVRCEDADRTTPAVFLVRGRLPMCDHCADVAEGMAAAVRR